MDNTFTDEEREIVQELAEWIATAPRDLILIMLGMMLSSTGKVA